MSKEEELLDKVFDSEPKWRGYPITWCDMCHVFRIGCKDPECRGSSCSGHSCEKCFDDHDDFMSCKVSPTWYLTMAEQQAVEKYWQLRRWMKRSLAAGQKELDWRQIHEEGWAAPVDYDMFPELKVLENTPTKL